jgi:hypothetical protein
MCQIISRGRRSNDRESSFSDLKARPQQNRRQNTVARTLMEYLAINIKFRYKRTVAPTRIEERCTIDGQAAGVAYLDKSRAT